MKVPLQLKEEWQNCEIDLAEIAAADAEILTNPFGLVFYGGSAAFSVRNVRYTKLGQTRIMISAKT